MISSMTSYATETSRGSWGSISWEIRSLNHRYLDLSFKTPETCRALEAELRNIAAQKLGRGKVECYLKYQATSATELEFALNKKLIKQLAATNQELQKYFDKTLPAPNPLHLLNWNNALQITEQLSEPVTKKIIALFNKTLNKLIANRKTEGAALKKTVENRLNLIMQEHKKIARLAPQMVKTQRDRLEGKLQKLSEKLNTERLEQEIVYFAQKVDIAEELDRLKTHVDEIRKILKKGGRVGKRLDFFMQELNRESNTIASKTTNGNITHSAVELKVLIEQMREQIQNIE